ncbi:hypothetical protein D3C73_1237580 [compost metagenome]
MFGDCAKRYICRFGEQIDIFLRQSIHFDVFDRLNVNQGITHEPHSVHTYGCARVHGINPECESSIPCPASKLAKIVLEGAVSSCGLSNGHFLGSISTGFIDDANSPTGIAFGN